MRYPIAMKEAVIKKVLMSGRPHHEIAKEAGIGRSALTYWLKNYKKDGKIKLSKKEKRPQDWTAEERVNALMERAPCVRQDGAEVEYVQLAHNTRHPEKGAWFKSG